MSGYGGCPFVEYILHPLDRFQPVERITAEPDRDRPRPGSDEVQLAVIGTQFGRFREAVPGARSFGVVRVNLALTTLDGFARVAVAHDDPVENGFPRVWWRRAGNDRERVTGAEQAQLIFPGAARSTGDEPYRHDREKCPHAASRLVILQPQVRDLVLAHEVPERVLQLGLLNEKIVF